MSLGGFVFLFRFFDKAGRGAGGITNVVVNVLFDRMLVYKYVFVVFCPCDYLQYNIALLMPKLRTL